MYLWQDISYHKILSIATFEQIVNGRKCLTNYTLVNNLTACQASRLHEATF